MKSFKNSSVYQETTIQVPTINSNKITKNLLFNEKCKEDQLNATNLEVKTKKKRRDKSDLGDDFIAPDGGWAWVVCIAAGMSNLCIYPGIHQFGLLFRDQLSSLGMTSSQITSIINTNPAISACTGLLNGPMFRRFTFRQVALAGSILIFCGLMCTAFCSTFMGYMIFYSILYGFGMGISVSASSLAINTYFKNKRRRAMGFSWTITGVGPIFLPYLVTFLVSFYGVQGAVIIFAGISLNSFLCALIYQPVHKHAPINTGNMLEDGTCPTEDPPRLCKYCEMLQQPKESRGLFSSQYLYQDDDPQTPGFEITEPGTPMLARANDGWFGSKLSLSSSKARFRTVSSSKDVESLVKLRDLKREHSVQNGAGDDKPEFFKPNNFHRERDEIIKHSLSKASLKQYERANSILASQYGMSCTCNEQVPVAEILVEPEMPEDSEETLEKMKNATFLEKVVTFFDLGLLRDFTYVNLVIGLTIINFGELNFAILTPFILTDFGFDTSQITLAMSLLAGVDIIMRFLVPFITEKMTWDNRVFFLIGVTGIAIGRSVVACTRTYTVILGCFVWIGICKGLRTIFWPLIIPGYVPLKRLPAASGLQLLISGLFTMACGPLVGLIRDRYDYSFTLHCLDALTFLAAISWTTEALVRRHYKRKSEAKLNNNNNNT